MSPLPHELHTGDVILLNATPRTILTVTNASVDNYGFYRLAFSDGSDAVVYATQAVMRVHPPDAAAEPSNTVL